LALNDAESCIQLRPTWPRGHACRGAALEGMDKLTEALESFKTAHKLSPSNPELVRLDYMGMSCETEESIS
jgi:stress-induced-phosphoprotein 1